MKIAIVDRFAGGPYGFSKEIFEYLKIIGHGVNTFTHYDDDLLTYTNIHFDWADGVTLDCLNKLKYIKSKPRITIRLHAYELHDLNLEVFPWDIVDCLIFVSKHYKNLFDQRGLHAKNIQIINHGVNLNKFKYSEHYSENILYVGSINFKKGPQLLAQVALAFPEKFIYVYGDMQCNRSKGYFNNLKINNIKFMPHTDKIHEVMQRGEYKFIISTSLGESFHLAVAEGMACGLKPLVHNWPGAKDLWPITWSTIDELKQLVKNFPLSASECMSWVKERYNAKIQLPKLAAAIMGENMKQTIAACIITRDNIKGLERALRSCNRYINSAYIAVDSRDAQSTYEKSQKLLEELHLGGKVKIFEAKEPWDFSYARNIAHEMNECDWALVIDDDEYIIHPEEIEHILRQHPDKDIIETTCGMGADEFGNVAHTWISSRFMKQHVRWKNPRHNIPDPTTVKSSIRWNGNIVVVDDKNIKDIKNRTARTEQRNTNIGVFRKKIDENSTDTRSMFYLATAYRESNQHWEAIHWYKHYLDTGGWDEERWQACYDMAACYFILRRYTDARNALYQAIKEKSNRAEAYVFMGDIFYKCNNFKEALTWYHLGCALPYPDDARLFVRKSIYDWERYDKISMAYSHINDYTNAIKSVIKALRVRPGDARLRKNSDIWTDKLRERLDATTKEIKT